MRVYRVERWDDQEVGAYGAGISGLIGFVEWKHPHPSLEEGTALASLWTRPRSDTIPYYFGFRSMEQMEDWFDISENAGEMDDLGLVVAVYEADDTYEGHTQLVFRLSTAKVVERMPVTDAAMLMVHDRYARQEVEVPGRCVISNVCS